MAKHLGTLVQDGLWAALDAAAAKKLSPSEAEKFAAACDGAAPAVDGLVESLKKSGDAPEAAKAVRARTDSRPAGGTQVTAG